ncbi:YjbF family lipoprotein [Gammaproteobacteria bacterium]|nr:YjbF family lipoprotein [Gammaproteobacteria bacterium]
MEQNRIAPGYAEAFSAINNAIFGFEGNKFSQDLISSIPYASSILQIGKGPLGLLILESKNNLQETWVSADGVVLIIESGRIIKTSGLGHNLKDLVYVNTNELNFIEDKNYYYSYDEPQLIDLKVEVKSEILGLEEVELNGRKLELILLKETIFNEHIGWETTNLFWYDSSGFVWKSIQSISPKLPKFTFIVTKKPS